MYYHGELRRPPMIPVPEIGVVDVLDGIDELKKTAEIKYRVTTFDTIYEIARRFNITPEEIIRYNNLQAGFIFPNMEIKIPVQAPRGYLFYTVKRGDNLYTIGQKYDLSAEELMRINRLKETTIFPDQLLLIPEDVLMTTEGIMYTVVEGDNLFSISEKFNINLEDLIMANPNLIRPGMVINIPQI